MWDYLGYQRRRVANVNCGILRPGEGGWVGGGFGGHWGPHQVISMGIKQGGLASKLNQIVNKHWDEALLAGQFQLMIK